MIVHNYGKVPEGYICEGNEKPRELRSEELSKIEFLGVDEIWYWCIDFIETEDYEGGGGDGMLLMRRGNDYDFWSLEALFGDDDDPFENFENVGEEKLFEGGLSLNTLKILFCEDEDLESLMEEISPLMEMAHGTNKKSRKRQTTIEEDMMKILLD